MTKTTLVPALSEEDRKALLEDGVLPPESSAKDRFCVMCPVKRGSPRLLPCCLCHNWCHIGCSYQTHLGRVCPCHVQILDPRRKIIVLRHPYHEDYVVLPTRHTLRPDKKNIERDVVYRLQRDDTSLSRWSPTSWLNILLEKQAWLSAGLVWMHGASDSGIKGVFDDSGPDGLESRPTINLFELWEYGAYLPRLVIARNYSFPKPLVVPCQWVFAPRALSLSDAVNSVSQHEEGRTWSQASHISMVAENQLPKST